MTLRARPTLTRLPAKVLYKPLDSTHLHSMSGVYQHRETHWHTETDQQLPCWAI